MSKARKSIGILEWWKDGMMGIKIGVCPDFILMANYTNKNIALIQLNPVFQNSIIPCP
jgi:hypothetical protein